MISINIYLRFALIVVGLGLGILFMAMNGYGFWYGFPFLLIGISMLVGYLLLGTVQSAAQMVQEQRFEEAEQRLKLTATPKLLYKTNRAFFYMLHGTLAMQRRDNDTAEAYLTKAKSIELPSDNEKAMVNLQLANIYATKNNWAKAKLYVNEMKKLKITEPVIKEQVKQFEKAFSNRGQQKHMMGMKNRKGFRQKKMR